MNLKFSAILLSVLFQGTLYASTLGVVAKINKSGIEAPNTVDDIVNGNKICEDKNTNDNNYPGCDMSTDTGYDEDTDSYDGDMIVRTGDFIELVAGWNITNGSEDVTITSTLPDNANLSWEPLSSLCADGSGIDGRTMTCIRSGYSSATSYSEDMAFLVKVSESNKNDTHTGEFSFKVDSSDADTAEDTTDGNELIITASPRWNLQLFLHQIEKDITVDDKEGYLLTYAFSMEEDEVPDENESGVDGYLGSESLGTDFTLNFTADMSDMSTNAKLVGCLDKDSSYEPLPYPYYIDEYKISTVATLKDDLNIQCSQGDDGNIVVNYSSLDASLNHIPSQSRTQSPYPEDRKVAAVGSIQVFIPYDDVTATDELTDEDGDKYYELRPKLKLRGFDPDSISSTSNFNDGSESLLDNDIETRLDYYPDGKAGGIVMKRFYRPDATVQLAESMVLGDGKGTVTPGDGFRSYLKVLNSGTKDFNNTILCDVIDTNTYNVTKIPGEDTPISVIVQPEDTNWSVEYAVGYVTNAWPNPSPSEDHSADVINECSDSSITWYDNYDDAIANGEVTKVRAVIDTLRPESGKNQFVMTVYHEAKGNDLNGDYLPAKTKLINYMAAHDDALFAKDDNHWHAEYKDMSLETLSRYPEQSDRVLLVRAKARISMDIDNQNAEIGDTREITISPTFTTNNPESNESDDLNISLYFADTLSYIPGSSNYGEPTIVHQYNTYYFKWDLGEHQVNKDVEPLKFNVRVEAKAKNTYYPIYATIISPNADPLPQRHTVDKSINVAVPRALLISKSVDTPFIEQDESMSFITYVQNGADDAITDLDMIDILPFNGDGVDGFNMTIDDTVLHLTRDTTTSPTNYNGTAVFTKAESDYDCSDDVTWYFSDTDPRDMDLSPKHDSNKLDNSGSTNWCQGTVDGPDSSCGFDNSKVTAVRLRRDSSFASSAVCAFRLYMDTDSNKQGDIYTNTTGASAEGVTLPVLSNDVSVIVPSTGLGDFVWADTNGNGIQDANESGIDGVTVELLDENDDVVKSVTTDNGGRYSFTSLSPDTEYRVKATLPKDYYRFTTKTQGDDDTKDSDVDTSSGITDIKKLNTNEQYNHFDIGIVSSLTVSGKVYKKDNNETISNIAVSLYLDKNNDNALDDNDKFIAKLDSDANGEYLFTNVFDGDYIVVVDKNDSDIPDNYELVGDDVLDVTVVDKNITNKDFPFLPPNIEPTTDDKLHKVIMNSQEVTLEELTGDDEDGSVVGFIIKSLPSDDQGTLYMSDGTTEVTVNQELTTSEAKDLKFVPKNDYVGDVTFTYSAKDDAGEIDSSPATFKIPVVAPIHIAGTIYDDGNGNGNIDGTVISTIEDNGIFVSLLDENDTLISSLEVEDNGTYDFNGNNIVIPNSKYHLVLTTQESGTIPTLPEDWNNADGENINSKSSTGNDGQKNGAGDGKIDVSVVTDSVLQVDFGINKKPVALDQNATAQINPGGDTKVAVPSLKISDNEDSTPSTITITDIPSNATLYYDSVAVNGGDTITNFDNSKLTVDPDNGNQSVIFKYTTTDKAGVTSEIATVEMPFTDIAISGKLFDDGNNNSSVDGNLISKADDTALYITLVKDGKAVASKELNSGLYEFTSSDGVEANTDYKLVLTDTLNGTTPTLPKTWNNADGEEIGTTGLDATADGQIDISLKEENIKDINFGINKQPLAKDIKESTQVNPGGDTKVAVPSLIISDKEDITPTVVTITELPSNATLYYKGEAVTKDSKITDVELDKFTIDPQDGDLNATFKYTTTDKAGVTSEIATVEMPFNTIEISGHIFNDGNNDGIVNGKGISAPNGVQLYVTLISDNGDILASKEVKSDGTYKFTNLDGIEADSKYIIVLSITQNSTTPSLPENWSNLDGEHIGTNAGDDGVNDGKIDVSVANSNVFEVNFGINKKPVAGDNTAPEQLNPGGDVQVTVPDLNISDNEDGTPKVVTIETVPSHGVLYYDGEVVKAGDTFNEFDNTLLRLDPDNGDQVVSFTYTTTDSVGVKSDIATISMSFRGLEISGNIYDDGNNNGKVDGNIISLLDGKQLYATLLNSTGKVLATTTISSNGSYTFDGVDGVAPNTTYNIVLATEANSSTANLPKNWENADGEHIGLDAGLDSKADGKIEVDVKTDDVVEVNFGINQQPISKDKNESEQINPGQNRTVVVPTLEISDKEDGVPTVVTITKLPDNGTLYYNEKSVSANVAISDFDNSKLTIDPIDGNQLIKFEYTSTDKAGFESEKAVVYMPFVGLMISGNVFDDGNGDGNVNGTPISQIKDTQLFVNLLDTNNKLISSYSLNTTGNYYFDGNDKITANTNYRLVLTIDSNGTTALLPEDWNNKDGENIGLTGLDGLSNGVIDVNLSTKNIDNINFGINERPTTQNVSSDLAINPNSTIQVVDLLPEDREDGTPKIVTINTLPTDGTLYYDNEPVFIEQNITDFDNSKLMVRPNSGNITIIFTYSAVDSTGWTSGEPSIVKMPFYVSETNQNLDVTDDRVKANTEGATTVINVLSNDDVENDVRILLVNIKDGEVILDNDTAVGGTNIQTTDNLIVPGEGTWSVQDDGNIVFTAEDGFNGTPTPVYYLVEDQTGNRSNIAEVEIITDCTCDTYVSKGTSDSVASLKTLGIISMIIFQMFMLIFFIRKEDKIV